MRALITGAALAVLLLSVASAAQADNIHDVGYCPGYTLTDNHGPNDLWWATNFQCLDSPAEELNSYQQLQYFDWDTEEWKSTLQYGQAGAADYFVSYLSQTSTWQVDDYLGTACYRFRTRLYVVEWQKSWYSAGTKYSNFSCF